VLWVNQILIRRTGRCRGLGSNGAGSSITAACSGRISS